MAHVLALVWVALLLVIQPIAAWRGRHRLAAAERPRPELYRGSALGIAAIGVVTLTLDLISGRHALVPVGARPGSGREGLWVTLTLGGVIALWLGIQWTRRLRNRPPGSGYLHLLPRTGGEKAAFVGLALLAGVAEEYAVRGFCLFQLTSLTGSSLVAAVFVTAGFGLGHAYQGTGGILRTTLAGAILVAPVLATGSLVPAILGHAALDTMTGLCTLPLLRAWRVVAV